MRERRVKPNAALYVGYADDDEDIGSIMAKFARLEKAQVALGCTTTGTGGDTGGNGSGSGSGPPKLSDDVLVRIVGAAAGGGSRLSKGVDFSMVDREIDYEKTGRLRPRGVLVGCLTNSAAGGLTLSCVSSLYVGRLS